MGAKVIIFTLAAKQAAVMKIVLTALLGIGCVMATLAQQAPQQTSGNPVFKGWYADPEATIFGKEYWIYPTYSAPYNAQVLFDAFSSPDLINWTKHPAILDTQRVKWARR